MINAIPLGCNSPVTADLRNQQTVQGPNGGANIAQPEMNSGRAIQLIDSAEHRPRMYQDFEDSRFLDVGDSFYVMWEFIAGNIGIAGNPTFVGRVQGSRSQLWQFYDAINNIAQADPICAAVGLVMDSSGYLTINTVDANPAQQTTTSSGTIGSVPIGLQPNGLYVKTYLGLKITLTSATQITTTAYMNGVAKLTYTHTNANGVGPISFCSFRAGQANTLAKGASIDLRVGDMFFSGVEMPHVEDRIAYQLPNSNGATNQWNNIAGGAADFSTVNDAFGAYSNATGNTSGLNNTDEETDEGFVAAALPANYQIIEVGLNAASGLNASGVDLAKVLGTKTGGSVLEREATLGLGALHSASAEMRWFETRGDGSPWTPDAVDSDVFYVRRRAI